jgi:hypothetical protein
MIILPELMGAIAVELMSQNLFEPYKVHVFDALAGFRWAVLEVFRAGRGKQNSGEILNLSEFELTVKDASPFSQWSMLVITSHYRVAH